EGDDGGDELATVTLDDQLAGVGADPLEHRLDDRRRDGFAVGGLEQVLLAVGDPQEAVVVELADVAGVEPLVLAERLGRRRLELVVAGGDTRAAEQDLAVLGDLDLGAGQGPADATELIAADA